MTGAGLLFVVAGQLCFVCLLVSQAKPDWFRFNGKTPSRGKIGLIWGLLAVVCALGAVSQGNASSSASGIQPGTTSASEASTAVTTDDSVLDTLAPARDEEPAIDVPQPADMPNDTPVDIAAPATRPVPTRPAR